MKIRKLRTLRSTTAALIIAAGAYSAQADTIVLDPDGSGNSPKVNNLNTFQFGAGNTLFQGSIPFTAQDQFQLLFQAQLNSVVTNTGLQITPIGMNATGAVGGVVPFEVTVVGSVTATVSNANTNTPPRVSFRLAGTQASTSFIELYYDGAQNANPLQGTGYNDGTLILRGVPFQQAPDVGMFSLTQPEPVTLPSFDLFATNDYSTAGSGNGNLTSVEGTGATRFDVTVTYVDPAFFIAPTAGDPGRQLHIGDIISFDVSHSVPFDKVDPSHKFAGAANSGTGAGPAPAATPRLGANNGTAGPDLQLQSLIAASVKPGITTSPTPTPSGTPTPTVSPTATPTPTPTGTPSAFRVAVSTNKTQIIEGNDAVITFTLKPVSTNHAAITVNYSVGGNATLNTDYTLSGTPGVAVIPANGSTATITLHANTDAVKEPNGEAAKIFVEAGTGYSVPTQQDAKRASVIIVDPST